MTIRYKTKAFIFKKNDINESDRIFSVFTDEFGRLDIFAKAIRKNISKLRSGIDIFFMSDIEFVQGKNKKTLTNASIMEKFDNIPQDLEKFKTANRIGEILDNFIKGEEKDGRIFILLSEVMEKLNNPKLPKEIMIFYYFLWNFFSIQGYRSEVQKCAGCAGQLDPYDIYYSGKEGGVICGDCVKAKKIYPEGVPFGPRRINSDIVKVLRIILSKDWQTLSKLKIGPSSQKLLAEVSENAVNSFCPS